MFFCCNTYFKSVFSYVLKNNNESYRRIEYGICPKCAVEKFRDFQQHNGKNKVRILKGTAAKTKFEQWEKRLKAQKHGAKSNQNFYYGDFKKTSKKDDKGKPVLIQIRKNFNGEYEEIQTSPLKVYKAPIISNTITPYSAPPKKS